jgi:hypothetical protein
MAQARMRLRLRIPQDTAGRWTRALYTLQGQELLPWAYLPRAWLGHPAKVCSQGGAICSLESADILFSWKSAHSPT